MDHPQYPEHPLDVVTLGEALVLLIANESGPLDTVNSFHKSTAGAETNVAIGLARLGLSVGWASRVGADSFGRYVLGVMQAEGIDCTHVQVDAGGSTGMMLKARSIAGEDPPIEYYRRGSAASLLNASQLDKGWLTSARHLHLTGVHAGVSTNCYAAGEHAIALMRAAGRTVSFDPNLRPALWPTQTVMADRLNALAFQSDWVLPGVAEGQVLCGTSDPTAIARFYLQRGAVQLVVVKLGADGAYWATRDAAGHVDAFPVAQVVDTVGAGDGFAVGVVSALLEGKTPEQAARRGAWIGAQAVQVRGDTEGLPSATALAAAGV
ncbi:MAG: sugar kinase [Burkholderiaceae bacterium]